MTWLTLHFEAEVGPDTALLPCARCHGKTLLVPLYPGGPTVQVDILAVEHLGGDCGRRLDLSRHICRRWRGACRDAMEAVLAILNEGEARERAERREALGRAEEGGGL